MNKTLTPSGLMLVGFSMMLMSYLFTEVVRMDIVVAVASVGAMIIGLDRLLARRQARRQAEIQAALNDATVHHWLVCQKFGRR